MHAGKHDFYAYSNALDETRGDRHDVLDHTAANLVRQWMKSAIITDNVFPEILYARGHHIHARVNFDIAITGLKMIR